MTSSTRPSWHDVRLAMAAELAKRSLCVRDQVGAVIVDAQNKIIGEGYNGPPRGFPRPADVSLSGGWLGPNSYDTGCDRWCERGKLPVDAEARKLKDGYVDCPSLHAEANALLQADRSLCVGGTIFVTSHVCFSCAKLIANSGLAYVVVRSAAKEHRPVEATLDFLFACGVHCKIYEEIV